MGCRTADGSADCVDATLTRDHSVRNTRTPAGMTLLDPTRLFADLDRDYLPHLSVNGVIFGAEAGSLRVLLLRFAGTDTWALPAGYVRRDEGVDEAAGRMVRESVGLRGAVLRQFHAFGAPGRVGAGLADALRALGADPPADHWALGRVVSVGYVVLVDAARAEVTPNPLMPEYRWCDVAARPPLLLDHDAMVDLALASVRAGLDALPLGATLLTGDFTMADLLRLVGDVNPIGESADDISDRTLSQLRDENPNIDQQLDEWRTLRRQRGEDHNDFLAFRRHLLAIGAPDPGEREFVGFRG